MALSGKFWCNRVKRHGYIRHKLTLIGTDYIGHKKHKKEKNNHGFSRIGTDYKKIKLRELVVRKK